MITSCNMKFAPHIQTLEKPRHIFTPTIRDSILENHPNNEINNDLHD